MRWLTAEGVMCSRSAATSMLPASSTAASVAAPIAGIRMMQFSFTSHRILNWTVSVHPSTVEG